MSDIWPQKWTEPMNPKLTKSVSANEKGKEPTKEDEKKKIDHKFNDYDHFYHNKY